MSVKVLSPTPANDEQKPEPAITEAELLDDDPPPFTTPTRQPDNPPNVQVVPEAVRPTALPASVEEAPTPGAALARQEMSNTVALKRGLASDDPAELLRWGQLIVDSAMFPNIQHAPAAVACAKMCSDLRLSPWISMGQFHIIEGKPVLSMRLVLQLVKRNGAKYAFTEDYGFYQNPATGHNDFLTEIVFEHSSLVGGTAKYRKWFSECVLAGWTGKHNWKTMPRTMLRARVITEACNLYFPDWLGGSYEFSEMVDAGKIPDHTYAMEV